MTCTRNELRQRIIRSLGGSMLKVELCVEDIDDAINMARDYFITFAVGNATHEVYFLLMLEAGRNVYDLPSGVIEVVNYHDHFGSAMGGTECGLNPLWYSGSEAGLSSFFSISDPSMVGLGYGASSMIGGTSDGTMAGSPYGYVDMYVARSTMQLVHNLRPDKYQWRYHKITNQIEFYPTPECGNTLTVTSPSGDVYDTPSAAYPCTDDYETETFDSPGYVMIRSYMMEGATLPTYTPAISASNDVDACSIYPDVPTQLSDYLWSHPWIIQYATALSKQRLGLIRRKFANNSSLGGASISLDGDSMVSEGREDQMRLEEEVDTKWAYEGYGLTMG